MATKKTPVARKRPAVGESIVEGLREAIAWTRGEDSDVRVTLVHVPEVDVREVRTKMASLGALHHQIGFPRGEMCNHGVRK